MFITNTIRIIIMLIIKKFVNSLYGLAFLTKLSQDFIRKAVVIVSEINRIDCLL
jgi:hypothetical protein